MQQETNNRAPAASSAERRHNGLWWLGGAGAAAAGLALYNWRVVRRAKSTAPPVGEFVTVEGVRLHYLRRGAGRPVVLLHGSGLALQDFTLSIFDQIAESHQTVALDRPGYGYSERPLDEPLTLALHARLIRGALAQLGIEKPIFLGHSAGASVALRYALDYPDALTGLVLIGPGAYAGRLTEPPFHYVTDLPVVGKLLVQTILAPLAQIAVPLLVAGMFAPNAPPAGYGKMLRAFAVRPSHFRTYAQELKHLDSGLHELSPHYGEIAAPVTILIGEDDGIVPPAAEGVPLQQALPNAQQIMVSGRGHMLHHKNPELVLAALHRMQQE